MGRTTYRRRTLAAAASAAGMVLIAACGNGQDQAREDYRTAVRDSPFSPVSLAEHTELGQLRQWDPCGMLIADAASTSTAGAVPSALTPGEELNECRLRLETPDRMPAWTFSTSVGERFQQSQTEGTEPVPINGVETHRSEQSPQNCSYQIPVSDQFAVEFTVNASITTPTGDRAACQVGQDYLTATDLVPKLAGPDRNPPLRSQGFTEPRLTLATKDPCVVPLQEQRAPLPPESIATTVSVESIYSCSLADQRQDRPPRERVRITFGYGAPVAGPGTEGNPVQIAGQPARAVEDPDNDTCEVRTNVLTDGTVDEDLGDPGTQISHPHLTASAPTCRDAMTFAERAMQEVST